MSDPPNHPLSRRDTYHRTRHHVSLYDFKPEAYGFAPFDDVVGGEVVKVEPWRIKGEVVRGIGRGSKSLGIPTANLPPAAWDQCTGGVPANTSGIYAGWASVGDDPTVYPTALSVGWVSRGS